MVNSGQTALSKWQSFVLISMSAMLGLSLSYGNITSSWLAADLICAAVFAGSFILILFCFRRGNFTDIVDAMYFCFSKPLARVIFALMSIYFVTQAANALSMQSEMIKHFLLETTPSWVVITAVALTSCLLFRLGLRQLARTVELLLWVVAPPLVLLLALGLVLMDWGELAALFSPSSDTLAIQTLSCTVSFWGFDALMFFLGTKKLQPKASRFIWAAFITDTIITIISFFITIGMFSVNGAVGLTFPLAEMSRAINIGGVALTERFDILFIIIRLVSLIVRIAAALYCSAISLCGAFCSGGYKKFTPIIVPAVIALSVISLDQQVGQIVDKVCFFGFIAIMLAVIPVSAAVCAIRTRKKGVSGR